MEVGLVGQLESSRLESPEGGMGFTKYKAVWMLAGETLGCWVSLRMTRMGWTWLSPRPRTVRPLQKRAAGECL